MDKKMLFENAYPFTLPEGKSDGLLLDEIKIPAQNVIARLNDQWVEEIGLDTKKFGYASSFRDLLSKKAGEKVTKENLLEKIKILQTIANLFGHLGELGEKQVFEYIEKEPIIYSNLRGSRDQSCFHHKKQLAVLLLEILTEVKSDYLRNTILDLIFEILDDNHTVSLKKTYFDEYNSYTYSEEQRTIAATIVAGIEKKLISLISNLGHDFNVKILRKLWNYQLLNSDLELKKKVVKQVYFGDAKLELESVKQIMQKVSEEQAPEEEILKEVMLETSIDDNKATPEDMIDFYSKGFLSSDTSNIKMLNKNIQKIFNETVEDEKRKEIIRLLISPKQGLDELLGEETGSKGPNTSHILSLVNLFLEDKKAKKLIFEILTEDKLDPSFHKDVYSKLSPREEMFKKFQVELAELLIVKFEEMKDKEVDKETTARIIDMVKNELIDEEKGEEFINLLLENRKSSKFSDFILQRIYQKASDSSLGKYLQYTLLTSRF